MGLLHHLALLLPPTPLQPLGAIRVLLARAATVSSRDLRVAIPSKALAVPR